MQEEGLGFGGGSVVLFDGAEEDGWVVMVLMAISFPQEMGAGALEFWPW